MVQFHDTIICTFAALAHRGMASPILVKEENRASNIISSQFGDHGSYRIERRFAPASTTGKLLSDLLQLGIPGKDEESFPKEAVSVIGDAGEMVAQHDVSEYGAALQNFRKAEYRQAHPEKLSLVYYIEQMNGGASFERSKEILSTVASPSILTNGGSAHLYMSAPGSAALNNHTDITDIVVLQLDGAKEWLLCTPKEEKNLLADNMLRSDSGATEFSRKLDSCSTYESTEMDDNLDCEHTILFPGDVLFLPRRVVHSARALSTTYSAHLTFGYNEDKLCTNDYDGKSKLEHRGLFVSCDAGCDHCCYKLCGCGCDLSCESDFWW